MCCKCLVVLCSLEKQRRSLLPRSCALTSCMVYCCSHLALPFVRKMDRTVSDCLSRQTGKDHPSSQSLEHCKLHARRSFRGIVHPSRILPAAGLLLLLLSLSLGPVPKEAMQYSNAEMQDAWKILQSRSKTVKVTVSRSPPLLSRAHKLLYAVFLSV